MSIRKLLKYSPLFAIALANFASIPAHAEREGGNTSGGGDKVEPLFIDAQKRATALIGALDIDHLNRLAIPTPYKNWLKSDGHLAKLQFYVAAMKLSFQNYPCIVDGEPRGTAFDNSNPNAPKMLVSYSFNQNTTPAQAEALVIHEAGHFSGEMNHIFLSAMGRELVAHPFILPTGNVYADSSIANPDGSVTFSYPKFRVPKDTFFYDRTLVSSSYGYLFSFYRMSGEPADEQASILAETTAAGTCVNLGYSKLVNYSGENRTELDTVLLDQFGRVVELPFRGVWRGIRTSGILTTLTCAP